MLGAITNRNLLILSSLITSGVNFLIFVIGPTFYGFQELSVFVRNNYVGGIYLFSVASSISIVSSVLLSRKNIAALTLYIKSCVLIFAVFFLFLVYFNFDRSFVNSIICLLSALILHILGFYVASLIYKESIAVCFCLQISQPLLFFSGILLFSPHVDWAKIYFASTLLTLILFSIKLDFGWIKKRFTNNKETMTFTELAMIIISSMSFSLFFQFEQIFVGEFTSIDLGHFVSIQRLYTSVSVALFGTMLTYLYKNRVGDSDKELPRIFGLIHYPLLSVFAVTALMIGMNLLALSDYTLNQVILVSSVSYLFGLSMFISFFMSIDHPLLNIGIMLSSSLIYGLIASVSKISTIQDVCIMTTIFFGVYLAGYTLIREFFNKGKAITNERN
ncbi:hypothetical protein [Vibrio splendidus]|uniref:hypothetical protein n=1 Tax=Vibrio splendidus TaxID=29497 RepID=UPI000C82AF96|nr:hypothetical protein [Vibrio splendidus]PMH10117.1 hypothetical protein BCU75_10755 [Vibrio splendidus]